MPGNETVGMSGKTFDNFPARRHVPDIVHDRERTASMQIGVVMRGIRRQHDRSAFSLDPHHLQAVGMPADAMQRDARRHLAITGMEGDALTVDMTHHQRHVLYRKW